jgi:hypothetical protein
MKRAAVSPQNIHEWPSLTRRRLEEQEETKCDATGECEMCTDAERASFESECGMTGRHQHFKCVTSKGDKESSSASYKSCKRTTADEQFLMIRLQAICFTIGVASLFSVRRNRQLGAFDQRREVAKRGTNILNLDILSDDSMDQEMVPLAPSDPLDVV